MPSITDVLIVLAVLLVFGFCVKSIIKKHGCGGCSSAATCQLHQTGEGHCVATQDMLKRAEAAFNNK